VPKRWATRPEPELERLALVASWSARERVESPSARTFAVTLPRTGFVDHIGIGVPDLGAAKEYYDSLMSVLGLREWFDTGPAGPLNYGGPDGVTGGRNRSSTRQRNQASTHVGKTGFHHLAFLVASRAVVREAHQWARARHAVVLDEPREFPQYGPHCFATYWLDPHGFKLEAVCHGPEES
jgi:catechol 2,3-dioxygenase-like lactoylglutathione lyase family enzyme